MFIVIEMQTNADSVGVISNAFDNLPDAEARYHAVLSAAAKSELRVHAAMLITPEGRVIKSEFYSHAAEAAE